MISGHGIRVFLGPSCSWDEARAVLEAEYRPPARRGDLLRAVADGVGTIVLIDGVLVYDYPPSPKEVFAALEQGVSVIGTASLGALRSVELRNHGMKGFGTIYQWYLSGIIDRDDEVVVPFDAETGIA